MKLVAITQITLAAPIRSLRLPLLLLLAAALCCLNFGAAASHPFSSNFLNPYLVLNLRNGQCANFLQAMNERMMFIDGMTGISEANRQQLKTKVFQSYLLLSDESQKDRVDDRLRAQLVEEERSRKLMRQEAWRSSPRLPAQLDRLLAVILDADFENFPEQLDQYVGDLRREQVAGNVRVLAMFARRLRRVETEQTRQNAVLVLARIAPSDIEFADRLLLALERPQYDQDRVATLLSALQIRDPDFAKRLVALALDLDDPNTAARAQFVLEDLDLSGEPPACWLSFYQFMVRVFHFPDHRLWAWNCLNREWVPREIKQAMITGLPFTEINRSDDLKRDYALHVSRLLVDDPSLQAALANPVNQPLAVGFLAELQSAAKAHRRRD